MSTGTPLLGQPGCGSAERRPEGPSTAPLVWKPNAWTATNVPRAYVYVRTAPKVSP